MRNYLDLLDYPLPHEKSSDDTKKDFLLKAGLVNFSIYLTNFANRINLQVVKENPIYTKINGGKIATYEDNTLTILDKVIYDLSKTGTLEDLDDAIDYFISQRDSLIKQTLESISDQKYLLNEAKNYLNEKLTKLLKKEGLVRFDDIFSDFAEEMRLGLIEREEVEALQVVVNEDNYMSLELKSTFISPLTHKNQTLLELVNLEDSDLKLRFRLSMEPLKKQLRDSKQQELFEESKAYGIEDLLPNKDCITVQRYSNEVFKFNTTTERIQIPINFKEKDFLSLERFRQVVLWLKAFAPEFYANQKVITFYPNEKVKNVVTGHLGTDLSRAEVSAVEIEYIEWRKRLSIFLKLPINHLNTYENYSNLSMSVAISRRKFSNGQYTYTSPELIPAFYLKKAQYRMHTYYALEEIVSHYEDGNRISILEKVAVKEDKDSKEQVLYYLNGERISSCKYAKMKRKFLQLRDEKHSDTKILISNINYQQRYFKGH